MLRVLESTIELIAVSFPLNSRPGIASVVHVHLQALALTSTKILLRQGEIDEDRVECSERHHLLARVDHLPNVHLANTKLAIERRDKRLLRECSSASDRQLLSAC